MRIHKTTIVFCFCLLYSTILFSSQKINKISGDNQIGISGCQLKNDFVVRVVSGEDTPLPGIPVYFTIICQPEQAALRKDSFSAALNNNVSITGPKGYAKAILTFGYPDTGKVLVSAATKDALDSPVIFTANSQTKNWVILLILVAFGGLGLFLFGMFYLNTALKKIAGQKLREVIITLTKSPLRGVGTGFFATLLNQASSATTVLEVSLVNAGLLTFYQSMSVTMGAEIGSTVTAQLVAFNLSKYAIVIVGIGFFVSVLSKEKKWKHIGETILGLGVLFLGMKIMSDIFSPMSSYAPFLDLMKNFGNPLFGIFAGTLFTIVVRSSGVTSGIVIAMSLAGAISLNQAIPLVLGSQLGTCFTAIIASFGRSRDAKKVALWHMFHQSVGVLFIYFVLTLFLYKGEPAWIYFVKWFTLNILNTQDLPRQIAVSHTLAAVINTAIFFPFLPLMNKLFSLFLPSKEIEKPFGPIYLDDEFLDTPSLALEQAKKEIIREGEIVFDMMEESLRVMESKDLKLCETISLKEIHADVLRNAIVPYLTKLGQGYLNEEQSRQETQLIFISDDLESIGDILDKNIVPLIHKKLENRLWFSNEGWQDIFNLHVKVTNNFKIVIEALKNNDSEKVKLVVEKKSELNIYQSELRKRHISRLHSGIQESLETSSVHLDLIDQLKSINSHVTAICYTLLNKV